MGAYVTNQKTSLHWLWLNFVLSYCHVLNLEDIAFYHVNFIHCICLRMHDHSFYFFNNIINNINYRSTLAGQVVLDIKISTFSAIVLNSIYYIWNTISDQNFTQGTTRNQQGIKWKFHFTYTIQLHPKYLFSLTFI